MFYEQNDSKTCLRYIIMSLAAFIKDVMVSDQQRLGSSHGLDTVLLGGWVFPVFSFFNNQSNGLSNTWRQQTNFLFCIGPFHSVQISGCFWNVGPFNLSWHKTNNHMGNHQATGCHKKLFIIIYLFICIGRYFNASSVTTDNNFYSF